MCREMFGWLRKLLGDIFVTVRFSLIFAVAVVVFLIWESCFRQSSENAGKFSTGFGFPSALLRYVVKAAGFALTSSIARTNRSHRSRELVGRMTGGGLISGQDSFVTSSNLGRYSSSLARWRSSSGDPKKLHQQFLTCSTAKLSSAWGETLSLRIHGTTSSLTSSSPPHTDFQSLLLNIPTANSFKRRKHTRRQWVSSCTFMAWPGLPGLSSLELRLHACTKYGNALRQLLLCRCSRPVRKQELTF